MNSLQSCCRRDISLANTAVTTDSWSKVEIDMAGTYSMADLLALILREHAQELRFCIDRAPMMVVQGLARAIEVPATTRDEVDELFRSIASEEQLKELHACGDVRFIYSFRDLSRFAVTATAKREIFELRITNLGLV
ncbi:MAG TPA: hypothetical protein VLT36_09830 [Candidatus Dormibacteraeota bacterium]|nr:hypothetical protein [Candidatus Dormibacteraeota bacterium]